MKHSTDLPIPRQQNNQKKTKTAILWGCADLLVSGFEAYLNQYVGWEVIRIAEDVGSAAMIRKVKAVKPDVVLLDGGYCVDNVQLPVLLLQAQPGLTVVVTFSMENNLAEIYSKQQVEVRDISDLLKIINRQITFSSPA